MILDFFTGLEAKFSIFSRAWGQICNAVASVAARGLSIVVACPRGYPQFAADAFKPWEPLAVLELVVGFVEQVPNVSQGFPRFHGGA
jgi:hypothetical protein